MIFHFFYLGLPSYQFEVLVYAYRELWSAGKNDPPWSWKGTKKPGPDKLRIFIFGQFIVRFSSFVSVIPIYEIQNFSHPSNFIQFTLWDIEIRN